MSVERYFRNKELVQSFNYHDWFYGVISITGLIIINTQTVDISKFLMKAKIDATKFIFCSASIALIIIFLTIYGIFNKMQMIFNKRRAAKLEESNKNLQEINDNVRCFKHDFNNIIQAIDGYIAVKDITALQKYFNKIAKECRDVNIKDGLNLKLRESPAIYGILLSKYKIATDNGIDMNIEISTNMSRFSDRIYTLSRIIGILLDNAIDAAKECENKVINIRFIRDEKRFKDLIIIENSYKNKEIEISKIFDKHYTTKNKKTNSGLGLWKIREILKKDTSIDLYTSKDELLFKQQIEVYEKMKLNKYS